MPIETDAVCESECGRDDPGQRDDDDRSEIVLRAEKERRRKRQDAGGSKIAAGRDPHAGEASASGITGNQRFQRESPMPRHTKNSVA